MTIALAALDDWRDKRVLVTGATGFVGGAVVRALHNSGAQVHILTRKADDKCFPFTLAGRHIGDITRPDTLQTLRCLDVHYVVHAAGALGRIGTPERHYYDVNVSGTRNILAVFANGKPVRVVHISSTGVLGPSSLAVPEDTPYCPTTPYERSKLEAENFAFEFAGRGLPVVVARLGFLYGPYDRHVLGLFRAIARRQLVYIDSGRHLCQPTFISDAIEGLLRCLRDGRVGRIYHVAGAPATYFQFINCIASALQVPPPRFNVSRKIALLGGRLSELAAQARRRGTEFSRAAVQFFSEDRIVSTQRIQEELKFRAAVDLVAGVEQTVAWYREQRWL
jgi:dihydroflavonol-4-reductase